MMTCTPTHAHTHTHTHTHTHKRAHTGVPHFRHGLLMMSYPPTHVHTHKHKHKHTHANNFVAAMQSYGPASGHDIVQASLEIQGIVWICVRAYAL